MDETQDITKPILFEKRHIDWLEMTSKIMPIGSRSINGVVRKLVDEAIQRSKQKEEAESDFR